MKGFFISIFLGIRWCSNQQSVPSQIDIFWPTAKGGEMHIPYSHYLACLCNIWSGSGCIVIVRAHVGFGDGHVLHLGNGVQGVQEGRICGAPLSQALCLLSCLLGHFDLCVLGQKSPHSAGLTSQYTDRGVPWKLTSPSPSPPSSPAPGLRVCSPSIVDVVAKDVGSLLSYSPTFEKSS